ncbi:hypothetical protein LP420_30295 [Massilia sp. B-10]|nr:hypothetical protein LP420_30295 [Massilia sp. B-10]
MPGQQFAVIGHTFRTEGSEAQREQAFARTRKPGLDFVVVTGLKGSKEVCTDELYTCRRDMLDDMQHPVIILLGRQRLEHLPQQQPKQFSRHRTPEPPARTAV